MSDSTIYSVAGLQEGIANLSAAHRELTTLLEDLKGELCFVHQTGRADLKDVRAGYASRGFQAKVSDFIEDMSSAYAGAELVVCRAGATTLAELTVCKKASILVPFPHATDNHQEVNAGAMVEEGAAVMFRESELTGERLAAEIRALIEDPARRRKMEKRSALLGRPEAAKELADVCVELMHAAWGPKGRERAPEGCLEFAWIAHALAVRAHRLGDLVEADLAQVGLDGLLGTERLGEQRHRRGGNRQLAAACAHHGALGADPVAQGCICLDAAADHGAGVCRRPCGARR